MIVDDIEFTYTIKSIDIETVHMLVDYVPTDEMLMPITFNVPFVEFREWSHNSEGEVVEVNPNKTFEEHKEYSVRAGAPIQMWRNQRILLNNLSGA